MTPTLSDLAIAAGVRLDEYTADLFASVASLTGSRAAAVSALRELAVACDGQRDLPEYPRWHGIYSAVDFAEHAARIESSDSYSMHVDWLADDCRRWAREKTALDAGGVAA